MRFYKTFILPIILWIMTFPVYASDYDCEKDTVDFNQGDVLSSEVFSEIINKINNSIVGISQSELNASWSCKTILDRGYGTNNGYSEDANGFYTMTQTLTFTEIDSNLSRVIYENNLGQGFQQTPAADCTVTVIANKIKFANKSESESTSSCGFNTGVFDLVKKSSTCFGMGQINDSISVCNKTDVPPDAPLNLFVSLTSTQGTINKKASLIWEAGDSTQVNYDVQRKNTASGTFASIATPTDTNYADTTITRTLTGIGCLLSMRTVPVTVQTLKRSLTQTRHHRSMWRVLSQSMKINRHLILPIYWFPMPTGSRSL